MHATIRRYEPVDEGRVEELIEKVNHGLVPRLTRLPGFGGYRFIDHGAGVMSSISLFETAPQAAESSRVAAAWITEEGLDELVGTPEISWGRVVAAADRQPAAV